MKSAEEQIKELLWINTIRREQALKILKEAKEGLKKDIQQYQNCGERSHYFQSINRILGTFNDKTAEERA